jgi:hypothetical protein
VTHTQGFIRFAKDALSENGVPSSARLISALLSLACMGLLWFIVFHMMRQTADKLALWVSNLPLIIGALATFSVSPYGVSKIAGIWDKKVDAEKKD